MNYARMFKKDWNRKKRKKGVNGMHAQKKTKSKNGMNSTVAEI